MDRGVASECALTRHHETVQGAPAYAVHSLVNVELLRECLHGR